MSNLCYYCKQDTHHLTDCPDSKKQSFNTWWQDDSQSNFRRPIIYSDNEGHIVEYIQVKVLRTTKKRKDENFKENQNFFVDKEFKNIIKSHRWYKKETDIVDENDNYFVNYMFPDTKIEKIKFKNNYKFDLRKCNIEILN